MTHKELLKRKDFLKILGLAGGGLLFYLAGWSWFRRDPVPQDKTEQIIDTEQWRPAYAVLESEGKLAQRVEQVYEIMENCWLCPKRCGVNRRARRRGFCQAPEKAMVYSYQPHFGEELPLVGRRGSGTIFFSNCTLRCVFCQNWPIAHKGRGNEVSDTELAEMMLNLQRMGCHNINVVTPTHVLPNILGAVRIAHRRGLRIPLCYNTGGYELVDVVKMLDGVVDIYLPDVKFTNGVEAQRYTLSAAADYPQMAKESTEEMHRQVGEIVTDARGIARRGLMIRHLVMPNRVAGTREFVQWVATNLSKQTYVNIMSQYRVDFMAFDFPTIARAITSEEFIEAMEWAKEAGLTNLDQRSISNYEIHLRRVS